MLIAMVMMQSLEMFPIWLFCVVVVQFSHFSWSHIFPFSLSPFPFPLSPFPFPLSPFPFPKVHKQIVGSNNQNQNQIEVVTYTTVNNRCAIAFQTGGSVFSEAPFLLGGGGEAGKHPIVGGGIGGGGMGGGGFPVKNLVWTMAGGGGGGHWTPRPTSST